MLPVAQRSNRMQPAERDRRAHVELHLFAVCACVDREHRRLLRIHIERENRRARLRDGASESIERDLTHRLQVRRLQRSLTDVAQDAQPLCRLPQDILGFDLRGHVPRRRHVLDAAIRRRVANEPTGDFQPDVVPVFVPEPDAFLDASVVVERPRDLPVDAQVFRMRQLDRPPPHDLFGKVPEHGL